MGLFYWLRRLLKRELAKRICIIEYCHICGRCVGQVWWADDDLWEELGCLPIGILCIRCFNRRANARGYLLRWRPEILDTSESGYAALCGDRSGPCPVTIDEGR